MNSGAPTPTNCLVNRDARIVEPPLIKEFHESVGPTGPCQRRNGVDHHPQWVFRSFAVRERLLRLLQATTALSELALSALHCGRARLFNLSSVYESLCVSVHTLSSFRQSADEALLSTLNTIRTGGMRGKLQAITPY